MEDVKTAKKTYIGYDLGDGETVTDLVRWEKGERIRNTNFDNMTMPGNTIPGQAMPTIFAYDESGDFIFSQTITDDPEVVKNIVVNFKRCPSDLLKHSKTTYDAEQIEFIKNSSDWPSVFEWPDGNTQEMLNFKNNVIEFTKAIFTNSDYVNRLKSFAVDSDEIVFCVGHPTNWTELDVAIYELILKNSVIGSGRYEGKKSSIVMEAESRAAFLYSKNIAAFGNIPKDSSVLLIDVGSSTIDITAMAAASINYQYNSGSNYLGARSIDFMIRDWYLEQIQQKQHIWSEYQSLVKYNPTFPNALTLACRLAKEQLYSSASSPKKSSIYLGTFDRVKLNENDLNSVIDRTPISKILKENINLSDEECALMGNKSWKQLFKDFLLEKKSEMTRRGIKIGAIILTGGASKMPFVPEIVLDVFNEVSYNSLKYDMDPSRTISKGLALVGPSNEEAKSFQNDLNNIINTKLESIIEGNIPALGEKMGTVISDIIRPIIIKRIKSWKSGEIDTLNEMNAKIQSDCSEENLSKLLSNNSDYIKTVSDWLKDTVGKDIAVELKELCDKYGVRDINVEDLNIMTTPKISITNIPIDPLEFIDVISGIVAIVAGVISAYSVATIMGVVVILISIISESLATTIFSALVAMGPVGWTILAAVIGVTALTLTCDGFEKFKSLFQDKVNGYNLPNIARKLMKDEQINSSIMNANLPKQIENAFQDDELKTDIVQKVSINLKGKIQKRAEDIKYAIANKIL